MKIRCKKETVRSGGYRHFCMGTRFSSLSASCHAHPPPRCSTVLCRFKDEFLADNCELSPQQHEVRLQKMKNNTEVAMQVAKNKAETTRMIVLTMSIVVAAIMAAAILGFSLGGHIEAGLRNLGSGHAQGKGAEALLSAGTSGGKLVKAGGVGVVVEALGWFVSAVRVSGGLEGWALTHALSFVSAVAAYFCFK